MKNYITVYISLRFWSCIGSAVLLCACTGRNRAQVHDPAAEQVAVVADEVQDEGEDGRKSSFDNAWDTLGAESGAQLTNENGSRLDASFGGEVDTLSATERRMLEAGLVEIVPNDSTISVHLVYATPDNFMGEAVYGDLRRAYLLPEVALMLQHAAELLHQERPDLRFIIYDAARPMSVQQRMWNLVKGTSNYIYVSNPARGGGLHNYGAAVDLTLGDHTGRPLPMGTPFDFFGAAAHINREEELLAKNLITSQELENRRLLRRVMRQAGFIPLRSEWWHFNAMSRAEAKAGYRVIE